MSISTPLYEIVRYRSELERLADSGEVPPEEIADTLQALDGDIKEKAVQVAAFTRNLESSAEAIREAGLAMIARAEQLERRAEEFGAICCSSANAPASPRLRHPGLL